MTTITITQILAVWEQLWQDTTEVTGPRQRTAEIRELNEMWRRS